MNTYVYLIMSMGDSEVVRGVAVEINIELLKEREEDRR